MTQPKFIMPRQVDACIGPRGRLRSVHDGRMLGGNTAFAHFGSYDTVDGEIVARLRTRRHSASPHPRSLVSSDSVNLRIRGRSEGQIYRFAGEVIEDAGSVFRAVMRPRCRSGPRSSRRLLRKLLRMRG